MVFSQSEVCKAGAQKSAARADQVAKEIILIGETHGTVETPRLFGNLVTVAAEEKNERIGVGLELSTVLQSLIDEAFKNNTTIDSVRERVAANPAWESDDGRSSEAMLDLVCGLLKLAQSRKVSLFFFDTQMEERNETMAQFISQRVREQNYDVTFILTGSIHANKAPRYPEAREIVPMGYRLEQLGFAVHSYVVRHSDGEAWVCTLVGQSDKVECGVHRMKGSNMAADSSAINQEGFDGSLFVGPIHASPPAHATSHNEAAIPQSNVTQ